MTTKDKQPRAAHYSVDKTTMSASVSGETYSRLQELATENRMTKSMLVRIMIDNFFLSNKENVVFRDKSVCFNLRIPDRKKLGVSLDNFVYRKLGLIAKSEKTTIAEVLRAIVEYYIDNIGECQNLLRAKIKLPIEEEAFEMYIDLA